MLMIMVILLTTVDVNVFALEATKSGNEMQSVVEEVVDGAEETEGKETIVSGNEVEQEKVSMEELLPLTASVGWRNWYYGDGWGYDGYVSWCISGTSLYIDMSDADIFMPFVANYYDIPWYTYLNQIKEIFFVDTQSYTAITSYAFLGSSVEKFEFQRSDSITLGEQCFAGSQKLTNVVLDARIIDLSSSAFEYCENLEVVEFANCIYLKLGAQCFKNCNSLTTIDFSGIEIEYIGNDAFNGCSSLQSIYLSNELNSIGKDAFGGCDVLKDVYFDGTRLEWDNIAIESGNEALTKANIHCNDDNLGEVDKVTLLNNPSNSGDGNVIWDCIWFGNYWQNDTNGDGKADENDEKQPIKWRVLSVDGNKAFLVSDKILDCKSYNIEASGYASRWSPTTIRSWLNGYNDTMNFNGIDYENQNFIDFAFEELEQESILVTSSDTTWGGQKANDKLFLLSVSEAENENYGFNIDSERKANSTQYAQSHFQYGSDPNHWWLRTTSSSGSYYADYVGAMGNIYTDGTGRMTDTYGVRPALYLDLSSANWFYAGKTDSNGTIQKEGEFEYNYNENAPTIWFTFETDKELEYTEDTGYNYSQFYINMAALCMIPLDNSDPTYKNVIATIELPTGFSFSAETEERSVQKNLGTMSLSGTKRQDMSFAVYIDETVIKDEFLVDVKLTADGYETPKINTYRIPVSIVTEKADKTIIDTVDRYASGKEVQEVLDIFDNSMSEEELRQRLFEYYNYNNMLDVRERIIELRDMHDERWDYEGLICDDMYLAWQYYDYLNNTPKGTAARVALYASGLVFNGEINDWINPSTYIDSELPGIKKYKSLLEEFIQMQNSSIEAYSYIKEAEKFINSSVGVWSATEKAEIIKRLKDAPDSATCKSIFNDFVANKISYGSNTMTYVYDGEKPAFMEAMGVIDTTFTVVNTTVDGITALVDVSSNLEIYRVYHVFLQEIYQADDLPWELTVAAYQLDKELEQAYWTPIKGILDEIRDECLGEAFDATGFKNLLNKNGWLSAINYTAFCINQFVDVGKLVVNSCHTEGYAFLAMHYKNKLEQCKQQFLANKTEENAWAFYEAYIMLWKLRIAGEEKFLQMSKLEGGTVVDGLSKATTGGTIAGLISDLYGYADKDAAVNSNLQLLKDFSFKYTIKETDLPDEYKYLQKMIVECPVSVEVLTADGAKVCVLNDGVETEITNEHGKFMSFYRATTGDYVKLAYFNSNTPYIIKVVGQDSGEVTYSFVKTEDHQTYTVEGFDKVKISEKDIIHITTNEEKYTIDEDGDGTNDIEGKLLDKSKVYSINVTNGTADKSSAYFGELVTINANPASADQKFKKWIVTAGEAELTSADSFTTTFTMPASNVDINAVYETSYSVKVIGGTTNKTMASQGDIVTITAGTVPNGMQFASWKVIAGNVVLADAESKTTTFIMPETAVEVGVVFKIQDEKTDDKLDEVTPKKGDMLKDDKKIAIYEILDVTKKTVEYEKPTEKNVKTVTIPTTVTVNGVTYKVISIADNAFKNNEKIKTVTIGKNVTKIGDNAFYKCTALTKVTIPNKVKIIGKNAFFGCKKLKTVTIGKNVSKIGSKAFYGCSKLKTLTVKSTKLTTKKIGSKAFGKTPKSIKVTVPKKKFKSYKSMLIKRGVNKKAKFKKG